MQKSIKFQLYNSISTLFGNNPIENIHLILLTCISLNLEPLAGSSRKRVVPSEQVQAFVQSDAQLSD